MHWSLQTRTCTLTILSAINNVCIILHLVTYFPRDWKNSCTRSKKEQQTLCWSRTKVTLLPMGVLEPQLPGESILGKHQCKFFLSWSSWALTSRNLGIAWCASCNVLILLRIILNAICDRQSQCNLQSMMPKSLMDPYHLLLTALRPFKDFRELFPT